jgi:predicted enzyme related to lactoylglutathione lyase
MAEAMLSSIGQIAINATDIGRATGFYRDKLAMKHLFSAGNLAFFDCGGVRLMLDSAAEAEHRHPSSILYFRVKDINAARKELVDRGVHFIDEPHMIARMPDHELWMTFFRDSEQNTMALMAEVR